MSGYLKPTIEVAPTQNSKDIQLAGAPAAVSLGLDGDFITGEKFGSSLPGAVSTSYSDISYGTPNVIQPIYSGAPLHVYIRSDSTKDALTGTGVQEVVFQGVSDGGDYVVERVELDGTTPVRTANKYYTVNRAYGYAVGSDGVQGGDLYIEDITGTDLYFMVPEEYAQSQLNYVSVPAGYKCVILDSRMSLDAGKDGFGRIVVREWIGEPPYSDNGPWRTFAEFIVPADQNVSEFYAAHNTINGPAEIKFQGRVSLGSGTAYARFGILMIGPNGEEV